MNKTQLKKIIKEELQAVLKEATPAVPSLDDLKVVAGALRDLVAQLDIGGLTERVRKVGREAKSGELGANLGTGETVMRISRLSADAAWKMSQANKQFLSDAADTLIAATQRREDRLALESQESQLVSKHGSDISPWSVAQDLDINQEPSDNALTANEIEDFISNRLIKLAGPVEQWTDEHLETFEQINNLLNVLFPSGK